MKIVLLNPPYKYSVVREGRCQHETAIWDSIYPPLSLATMAAFLRDANDVAIIDAIALGIDTPALLDDLAERKPDLVIVSVSTPTIHDDLVVLKQVKARTGAAIAVFGVHATYYADDLIKEDFIDYVLLNDPDRAAVRIAEGGAAGVEGTVAKDKDGRIVRTPFGKEREPHFRPPAWDLVDLKKYKIPIKGRTYVLVTTARGCPFNCNFCVVPFYSGRHVRVRPIPEVIAELKAVPAFVRDVFFHTDLFTFKKDYVLKFCEAMVRENLNLRWICNSRVDTFDLETAQAMKKAGCWMVSFGIESGSQKILDLCGKKITLDQSRTAVAAARRAGLLTIGHFVLGFPGETEETLAQTLKFSREINPDFVEYYIATPFPGSELFERIKGNIPLDWKDIRYDHNPYEYAFDLGKIRKKAYFGFYLRPGKIFSFIRIFGPGKIVSMAFSGVRFLWSFRKGS
jgi:anaerobic magnesium-protoporphyrin IX monomethyl ester cyclase